MPLYLRLLSPRPLSPALPFGFGVGFRPLFSTSLVHQRREGVVSSAPLVRTRRPSPNHQTLSFASLRLKLQRFSSVFPVGKKKKRNEKSIATRKKESGRRTDCRDRTSCVCGRGIWLRPPTWPGAAHSRNQRGVSIVGSKHFGLR